MIVVNYSAIVGSNNKFKVTRVKEQKDTPIPVNNKIYTDSGEGVMHIWRCYFSYIFLYAPLFSQATKDSVLLFEDQGILHAREYIHPLRKLAKIDYPVVVIFPFVNLGCPLLTVIYLTS